MEAKADKADVFFRFCGEEMLLNSVMPGVWRLRSAKGNSLKNDGAAQTLARDLGENEPGDILPVKYEETESGFSAVSADGSRAEFDGKTVSFYNCHGALKRRITSVKTEGDKSAVTLKAERGEHFYGTGERFDSVERRGKSVKIYAIDRWCRTKGNSYIPIPFLLSSNCSAVFMNRYERSEFDTCRSSKNEIKITQYYAPVDLYVFSADTPGEILKNYSSLTGFAPMPPEWAFGTLVCRYHPEFETKEGVFAMANAMNENGFPFEAVILEGFRAFKTERRAELKEISEKMHSMGKHVMVYEPCGRFPANSEELFGLDDSYAVSSSEGTYLGETMSYNKLDNSSRKKMRCVDVTSERSREKWYEFWDELVRNIGVDGAKIDFCEQFPDSTDLKFADGRDPMAAHHWYPTLYNIMQLKHFSERPDGGLNLSRGGGIGAQRYPFVWEGDQRREFFFFRPVINGALSLGLSGVPFVTWDMAGYQPSFSAYDRRHEDKVFIRGLEFTAFSPTIQTHGRVKRPYDFDDKTKALYRAYSLLHESLRPYLTEQAKVACETGMPLMRHLFLYDCEDRRCMKTHDEYMLGCGLLVAPVIKRKNRRSLYLPKGRWIQIFTGEKIEGPREIVTLKVPLGSIPVFRLEGAESDELIPCLESAKPYINEINELSTGGQK